MEIPTLHYKNLVEKHGKWFEQHEQYRKILKKDKDNINLKVQYELLSEKLNQVRKELREYEKIKKYIKQERYDDAFKMSLGNNLLKYGLYVWESAKLTNYYEERIKKAEQKNDKLRIKNKSLMKSLEEKAKEKD